MGHEYGPLIAPTAAPVGESVSVELDVSCPSDHSDNQCSDQSLQVYVDGEQVFEELYGTTRGGSVTISVPGGVSFDSAGAYTFEVETSDGYTDSETVFIYDPATQPEGACEYTSSDLPPSFDAVVDAIEDYNDGGLGANAVGHIATAHRDGRVLEWCGASPSDVDVVDCSIPSRVASGDVGTISATFENTGGDVVSGSAVLLIEGGVQDSEPVSIPSGESVTVEFGVQFSLPGDRQVSVGFD